MTLNPTAASTGSPSPYHEQASVIFGAPKLFAHSPGFTGSPRSQSATSALASTKNTAFETQINGPATFGTAAYSWQAQAQSVKPIKTVELKIGSTSQPIPPLGSTVFPEPALIKPTASPGSSASCIASTFAIPGHRDTQALLSTTPWVNGTSVAKAGEASGASVKFSQPQPLLPGHGPQGTAFVVFAPYEATVWEDGREITEQYQSVVFQAQCNGFSVDELRLADYSNGLQGSHSRPAVQNFGVSSIYEPSGRFRVTMMRGPTIAVVVGAELNSAVQDSQIGIWSLPQALLSHYSGTLKDVCRPESPGAEDIRIALPKSDPVIFDLFVEWIYYGSYTVDLTTTTSNYPGVSLDAQAWILGDTIKAVHFKNYVMERLYNEYSRGFAPKPITIADVKYVCTYSAKNSKMLQLFLDLLALHFRDTTRVKGTIVQWDDVMQQHPRIRLCLLLGLRSGRDDAKSIHPKETYMEKYEVGSMEHAVIATAEQIIPAKRDANGAAVKVEPKDA